MTKRQLRRAAALLDQVARELWFNEAITPDGRHIWAVLDPDTAPWKWPAGKAGRSIKTRHDELHRLAEALLKEVEK